MNLYLIIAGLVAVMAAGAGGFKLGVDHEKATQVDKQALVAEAVDAANAVAAEAIAGIRVTNTTIQQEIQREIRTNTIYGDCRHTPDGLRQLNEALAPPERAGDSKLPGTDPAGR